MAILALICVLLLVLTTVIHYEVLRTLSASLPAFGVPARTKLIAVIFGAFFAHVVEMSLYAFAIYLLVRYFGLGTLGERSNFSLNIALYFSAETFTSLGYGDIVPSGDLRLLAGAEALNGLLLIGWSASYTYIAMERFWSDGVAGSTKPSLQIADQSGPKAAIRVGYADAMQNGDSGKPGIRLCGRSIGGR